MPVLDVGHALRSRVLRGPAVDIRHSLGAPVLDVGAALGVAVGLGESHRATASVAAATLHCGATLDHRMATAMPAAAIAAAATTMWACGRRCSDCQGGHACGQKEPGHDRKLPLVSAHQRKYGNFRSCDEVRFICDGPRFGAVG
jgi:hypothetical protein